MNDPDKGNVPPTTALVMGFVCLLVPSPRATVKEPLVLWGQMIYF